MFAVRITLWITWEVGLSVRAKSFQRFLSNSFRRVEPGIAPEGGVLFSGDGPGDDIPLDCSRLGGSRGQLKNKLAALYAKGCH